MDIFFVGTYNCKADAKGRVMLPVTLKNQITPILNDGFVIKRSMYAPCLELYPMYEWNTVMQELNAKSRYEKDNIDFIRKFTAGLKQVEIDTTGRLLIPKNLTTLVGITKDVVLASIGKNIEIWDKDRYEQEINVAPEEVASLAKKVMGGKDKTDGVS
ncbi:division/cell wall cluster transcriptional repressor MraZ [Flavobacteriaceae bacterium 3-367]|uniref:division/cell wall cluster transcriptional repressor MraZ n=1 Tax=Eudoraea algarum TaxID=3417568 RepID=UPI00328C9436